MVRIAASSFVFLVLLLFTACAEAQLAKAPDKEAIETIVHDYLMNNPEVVEEALIALQEKRQAEEEAKSRKAIADNQDLLYKNATDYAIGPNDANVTVVEFFDYRCGYCKRSIDWIQKLPEKYDGNVRVVLKEFPILSPQSEQAALAALAAGKQGKYSEMHVALMESKSSFGTSDIDKIAKASGVDVTKMRADMRSTEVQKQLSDMKSLGKAIGVGGTPAFYIGDKKVPGGANETALNDMIKAALK